MGIIMQTIRRDLDTCRRVFVRNAMLSATAGMIGYPSRGIAAVGQRSRFNVDCLQDGNVSLRISDITDSLYNTSINFVTLGINEPAYGSIQITSYDPRNTSFIYAPKSGWTGIDTVELSILLYGNYTTIDCIIDVHSGVQLPEWPVSYTAATYYVSAAAPAGNALSQSRSNPGNAQHALNNAP